MWSFRRFNNEASFLKSQKIKINKKKRCQAKTQTKIKEKNVKCFQRFGRNWWRVSRSE